MAQHDYNLANAQGALFRSDLNDVLSAIRSQNSGATEPPIRVAQMWWYDTTTNILKQRNSSNTLWIELFHFDQSNNLIKLDFDQGVAIASATTTNIAAAGGNYIHITGTTTITNLGTVKAGAHRWVTFDGVLTLTYNATSLILPGGVSITTAAGDSMLAVSEGSGNWRVLFYSLASGFLSIRDIQQFTSSGTYNKPLGVNLVIVESWGGGGSGAKANSGGVSGGSGGGGGGYVQRILAASDVGSSETVTIGAGGASVTVANTAGNAGGNTTFGSLVTAYGGGGARGITEGTAGGGGGAQSAGQAGVSGGAGGDPLGGADVAGSSQNQDSDYGGGAGGNVSHQGGGDSGWGGGGGSKSSGGAAGGNSVFGGGGGSAGRSISVGAGGTSVYGGDGGIGGLLAVDGTAGAQPGGGGGGAYSGNSGAGGDGQMIVWSL